MEENTERLLQELIDNIKDKNQLSKIQDQLFKRGVESLLKAELTAHLGYAEGSKPKDGNQRNGYSKKTLKGSSGDQTINVPRDREASFDPVTVPKHKTMSEELADCIILLYAKGMSNSDIIDFVEHTYGVKYSTSQVSIITNSLLDDINQWRSRPLESQYAVLWIDGIHFKIRDEGKVQSKACMICLGIDMEGRQDILSMDIVDNESAVAWMTILDGLRTRGVQDVIFLCSDNLKGLDKAVQATFPDSVRQICIVHQIRNSLQFVSYKDRKAVAKEIKTIYGADNEAMAKEAFETFKHKYQNKYDRAISSWENNWVNLTAFLDYPLEIRKLIYTTNIIESFNAGLRKYTNGKRVFPNDNAALKSIYLAAQQVRKKWQKSRIGWPQIYNQLYINFENRIKPAE